MTIAAESLRVPGEWDDRFYTYPPTQELFTSVTTITGGTSSKPWLGPWEAKLAAEYAVTNLAQLTRMLADETAKAADNLRAIHAGMDPGEVAERAARAAYATVVKDVKGQARKARDLKADTGKYIHAVVEALVLWAASPKDSHGRDTGADIALPSLPEQLVGALYDDEPIEDVADWMITGFMNWVADFDPEFLATEMTVFNPDLRVAGTLDMIVALMGRDMDAEGGLIACPGNRWIPCVDVKTGKNLDGTVHEQITTYRRMKEALLPLGQIVPMPKTDASAVLHLRREYPRGYRFTPVSRRHDALGWNRFRRAAEVFTGRADVKGKVGRPAYPLRPDGTVPPRLLADLDGEGYRHVPGALAKAGVDDLELLAALTEAECLDLKGIGPKAIPIIRTLLADHGLHLAGDDPRPATGEAA